HIGASVRGAPSTMMSRPPLTVTIMISTLGYLGLAIIAAGGPTAFFSHAALVVLTILILAMAAAASFSSGNLSSGEREDRGNRWVILALSVIGFFEAFLPPYTDRIDFWTIDGELTRWLGVALFALGGVLRLWPVFVLGHRFSGLVAIQP